MLVATIPADAPIGTTLLLRFDYYSSQYYGQITVTDPGSAAPPVAKAGPDQTALSTSNSGKTVSLDGSASTDPDDDIAIYKWRENGLVIATGANPSVLLTNGSHTITLTVQDETGLTDTDTVLVDVKRKPIAKAGSDQVVEVPTYDGNAIKVYLYDGGSSDPDGSLVSQVWKEGSTTLGTTTDIQPILMPGVPYNYPDRYRQRGLHRLRYSRCYGKWFRRCPRRSRLTRSKVSTTARLQSRSLGSPTVSLVTIKWPDGTVIASTTVNSSGAGTTSFRTPLVAYGTYTVTARDASNKQDTTTLSVIPRIKLTEYAGPVGIGSSRVYFYGFSAGEQVQIQWFTSTTSTSFKVLKTVTIASNGSCLYADHDSVRVGDRGPQDRRQGDRGQSKCL